MVKKGHYAEIGLIPILVIKMELQVYEANINVSFKPCFFVRQIESKGTENLFTCKFEQNQECLHVSTKCQTL